MHISKLYQNNVLLYSMFILSSKHIINHYHSHKANKSQIKTICDSFTKKL
jgi:hypothetical protein